MLEAFKSRKIGYQVAKDLFTHKPRAEKCQDLGMARLIHFADWASFAIRISISVLVLMIFITIRHFFI